MCRFPWGVMLLFGAGFALAEASKVTKLENYFVSSLIYLGMDGRVRLLLATKGAAQMAS